MARVGPNPEELARRAKQIYDQSIRARVEPAHIGDFVVLDVDSGDFEVGADMLEAFDQLKARRPQARPFLLRAGYPTAAVLEMEGTPLLGMGLLLQHRVTLDVLTDGHVTIESL